MVRLFQLRVSARRRPELFKDDRIRRRSILGLVELMPTMLVSFSLVFKHGHIKVYWEEEAIGYLRRSIRRRLSKTVGVPFEPVWYEPVEDEPHAFTLLEYDAKQIPHHDIPAHPALFDGSYFQDVAGARALPDLRLRILDAVPYFRLRQIHAWVGLPPAPIQPATDETIGALGIQRLKAAAASATAADPELRGRCATEVRAKRVVAHLARQVGIRTADVRTALKLSQSGVDTLRCVPADSDALQATRIRLALEETVTRETWKINGS